jgi:hypothetical protein
MKWLRKKVRGIGRGIKKAFRGIGGAFKKVFGVFGKLGPIGSIALMFIMPGIGAAFAKGLGMLQGAVGTAATAGAAAGAGTAAGAAGAAAGAGVAGAAGAGAAGTAATALSTTAGSGLLGSTNAALRAVGRIGQAIVGDANTLSRTLAGEFSLKSGLVGNMGTATNKLTGWLKDGLDKLPGAEPFEDWLNQKRGDWGFETNKGWMDKQEAFIKKGMSAEVQYNKALQEFSGGYNYPETVVNFEKEYFGSQAGKTIQTQMAAGTEAQGLLNRSMVKPGGYPSIAETEKAFKEGWKVDTGKVVMKEGEPVKLTADPDEWNPKKVAANAAIQGAVGAGFSTLLAEDPIMPGGGVQGMPQNEQAKDYYVSNMMNTYKTEGYQGPDKFQSILDSPWIYGSGTPDWLVNYGQGISIPAPQPIQIGNA